MDRLNKFYDNVRTEYSLDIPRELMQYLGNPQEKFRVIHVAGTSGKTSTAYYAAACLTAAGHKTGLTVSPHVDEIGERLQINMQVLPDADVDRLLDDFLPLVEASGLKPSWFEVMVALAYWYFAREGVEYAVIEVGLGGLLDGTNVVHRADKVCVITDIGLDHTAILGNTIAEIAVQKAGIIQSRNEVVMYKQGKDVMTAVDKRMREVHGYAIHALDDNDHADFEFLPNLPLFQRRNFWLALKASQLALGRQLSSDELRKAQATYIPGRMEIVDVNGKLVVLDGSHNSQKLNMLSISLKKQFSGKKIAALVAFSEGDEARLHEAVPVVVDLTDEIVITSFASAKDVFKKSVDTKKVAQEFAKADIKAIQEQDTKKAFSKLLGKKADVYLVAGSFYLLNHIRPLIGASND